MKRLLIISLWLLSMSSFAANPSFQDFNPNQFFTNGNKISLKAAFTNAVTLWVDPNGNDSTAQRGIPALPWRTPTNAMKSAQSGDTVFLNSGVYTITNSGGLVMGTNVSLTANFGTVTLINMVTNSGPPACIVLSTGCKLSGLIITNAMMDSFCQRCIGINTSLGQSSATNVIVEDCLTYGDCDNLHFILNSRSQVKFIRVVAYSKWDTFALQALGAGNSSDLQFLDCNFFALGKSVFNPTTAQSRAFTTTGDQPAVYVWYGGLMFATNGNTGGAATLLLGGSAETVELYGTTVSQPINGTNIVTSLGSTLNLYNVNTDPTPLLNGSGQIAGTVNIYPLSVAATNIAVLPIHDFADHDFTLGTWNSGDAATIFKFGGNGNLTIPGVFTGNGGGETNILPRRLVAGTGLTATTNNPGQSTETLTLTVNAGGTMNGGGAVALLSTTTNFFFCGPVSTTAVLTDSTNKACPMPYSCRLGGLTASTSGATLNSGTNITVRVLTNGIASSITLLIDSTTGFSTVSDNTHTESVAQGTKVCVSFQVNSNISSQSYSWGLYTK